MKLIKKIVLVTVNTVVSLFSICLISFFVFCVFALPCSKAFPSLLKIHNADIPSFLFLSRLPTFHDCSKVFQGSFVFLLKPSAAFSFCRRSFCDYSVFKSSLDYFVRLFVVLHRHTFYQASCGKFVHIGKVSHLSPS